MIIHLCYTAAAMNKYCDMLKNTLEWLVISIYDMIIHVTDEKYGHYALWIVQAKLNEITCKHKILKGGISDFCFQQNGNPN